MDRPAVDQVVAALRTLELAADEARAAVREALARVPGKAWTTDDLVGEALRALPSRA